MSSIGIREYNAYLNNGSQPNTNGVTNTQVVNNSVFSTSNNTSQTETSQQSTTDSKLENALATVIGENYPKIKEDLKRIFEKLGISVPPEHKELDQPEIDKIVAQVQKLVNNLKAKKLEITAENLFNEACISIDNHILEKCGLTREEFETAVQNGEVKSLREILGLQEGEEITEEKVTEYAKRMIAESQERIKNSPNPQEAMKEEIALQKRKFGLILVATPVEDRAKFQSALKHLYSENKLQALSLTLLSLNPEERSNFCNNFNLEEIQNLFGVDANGNTCDLNSKTGIVAILAKYQSGEAISANEEALLEEALTFFAREDVANVMKKQKNGEELTEAEQEIAKQIETYTGISSGLQIGTANNTDLAEDERNNLLDKMNRDTYELPIYENVLKEINDFVSNKENAEYLSISKEKFTEIMDKATNGNYTTVAESNGAPVELKAPKDKDATSASSDLGYVTGQKPDTTRVDTAYAQIIAQSDIKEPTFEIVKDTTDETSDQTKNTSNWTRTEICKNPLKYIRECYGSKINEQNLILAFNRTSETLQSTILSLASGNTFNLFLGEASNSVILDTDKGRTSYQTKLLEEKHQEIEEQKNVIPT